MRLLNEATVSRFIRKHQDASPWLNQWVEIVKRAPWSDIGAVRRAYASADGVKVRSGSVVTVFNVKGGNYRLLTYINYTLQTVVVAEILTHPEYDKQLWKDRL